MSDFIREVDEEVRSDRFKAILDRYWYVLAALVVLVLGGVGAWKAYDYFATQKAESASSAYLDALDLAREGKTEDATKALQQVEASAPAGYRLLARLRLAGQAGLKDPKAGAAMFDGIGADPSVDPALQSMAKLRAGLLLVDQLSYPDLKTRLDPLADANSPVRNAAREMLALAALKAGRTEDAGSLLDAIETDPTTTAGLRQRAEALLGLVHGAGEAPVVPAPAPVAAPAEPAAAHPAAEASPPPAAAPATAATPVPASSAPAAEANQPSPATPNPSPAVPAGSPPAPAAPPSAPAP